MARKPKNDDIGEILCPFCNEKAPVRRDINGKLYYVSKAGMIKPNMPNGQDWMLENAMIWSPAQKAEHSAVTEPEKTKPVTSPATMLNEVKIPPIPARVPVNESTGQNPVTGSESPPEQKPSFVKWLIG
ncbi:hypothetical protein [Shewanella scandinavica]|uniref:hypothetical protein n=1 Tax=Shewanella scandinavica TaxID=3063538 RepID=UPI0031889C31